MRDFIVGVVGADGYELLLAVLGVGLPLAIIVAMLLAYGWRTPWLSLPGDDAGEKDQRSALEASPGSDAE